MAEKIGVPSSTVKSWDTALKIPKWRHDSILAAAARCGHTDVSINVKRPGFPGGSNL
ncbi:hypothetical protein [Novosphingobium sp. ST904]|uniref:hypothetical protein n=1 Tax=Novosphingobium sp. ST904 TaxID=1684385 RepID=UPI0035124CA6